MAVFHILSLKDCARSDKWLFVNGYLESSLTLLGFMIAQLGALSHRFAHYCYISELFLIFIQVL